MPSTTKLALTAGVLAAAAGLAWMLWPAPGSATLEVAGTPSSAESATADANAPTGSASAVNENTQGEQAAQRRVAPSIEGILASLRPGLAKDWVLANRSMETDTDKLIAIVEIRALSALDRVLDGEQLPLGEVVDLATSEAELRWAVDVNLDGTLDEQEFAQLQQAMARFNPVNSPYVQSRMDADGDGQVSQEEALRFQTEKGPAMLDAIAQLGEITLRNQLDRDNDGTATEAERNAVFSNPDAIRAHDLNGDGALSIDERRAVSMAAAQGLTTAMAQRKLTAVGAQLPSIDTSFQNIDADGNGEVTEAEAASARDRWQTEYNRLFAATENAMLRYDASVFDLDGNGAFSAGERLAAMEDRRGDARQHLAVLAFDSNGNGQIDPAELQAFSGWYRAGAPRADANLDGRVTEDDFALVARLMAR